MAITDAECIAALVEEYLTEQRHPALPPFTIHHHNKDSIFQWKEYPETGKPGVYVHYDSEGRLDHIGKAWFPAERAGAHQRNAKASGHSLPARIDLISVISIWEVESLEHFLQIKFPGYYDRWNAWVARQATAA